MQVHYGITDIHIVNPVVTMGSFDGVHKGHVQVIENLKRVAAKLGGESVIISFEPHPREVLYPLEKRPGILTTLEEKIGILKAHGVEHLVILPFTEELANLSYSDFVKHILVDKLGIKGLVVGYDHRFGKNREGSFEVLKAMAGQYRFYLEQEEAYEENQVNISSTKIRTALELGNIALVREYLGYDYPISGKVVHGDKIGRDIGFPTANLQLEDERKLLPASGVYAVRVSVDGVLYDGMLNIGVRPTVSRSGIVRLEVNIFGFQSEIYGKTVSVFLLSRVRGERKFNDVGELKSQLKADRQWVLEYLACCKEGN